jgi:ubiquinone biosynthesis protein UbiJ
VLELARDRAALKKLMLGLDEPALRLSTERLSTLAEASSDPEVAELYRSAHRVRDQQLALLENLKEIRAAGDAHWEHLSAVIGELATSTALRGMRGRIQAQEQALQRLRSDVAEYRAVLDELRVSLGEEERS